MNPNTQKAARPRPEPVARQHQPGNARRRHAGALHRGAVDHRADLEPDDLRARDRRRHALRRRRSATLARAGQVGRGPLLRARAAGPDARPPTCSGRSFEATGGVDGWVSLEVSPLLADDTARTIQAAARLHARGGTAQPLHQDSRNAGRRTGDRGIDLRRRADQRHAAVLARAIPGGRRGLPARHRAAHRRRPRSEGRVGRLAVRQPLGRRREGKGLAAQPQPPRHRDRDAHLQGLPRPARPRRAGRSSRRPAPIRSGCSGRAPAPRTRPRPTRSTSRRSPRPTPSTRCRKRRCRRSPTTARSARRCRSTAAMPRRCSTNCGAKASTTTRWPSRLQREGADAFAKSWRALLSRIAEKSSQLAAVSQ